MEALRQEVSCCVIGITNVRSYCGGVYKSLMGDPFSSRSIRWSTISISTSLTVSIFPSLELAISDTISILDSLWGALRRPRSCEARSSLMESRSFRGDGMCLSRGFKGGKHAASRPMDTSAVIQKVGGVVLWLTMPTDG